VSFSNNSGALETVTVVLDGVAVNLNDLVASGQATLTSVQNDVVLTDEGGIQAVYGENISSIATLTLNVPFTSLALDLDMEGGGMGVVTEVYVNDIVPPVVCFCAGTLIRTETGNVPIERLKVGDMVQTFDNDLSALHWTGHRKIGAKALKADPKLRPVRVRAGALGQGLPKRDIWVSRQHRILMASRVAKRMFGTQHVLVPAIKLVGMPGIDIDNAIDSVAYHHIAFDRHQVVFAEEAPMESLLLGREAIKSMTWAAQVELRKIFPEMMDADFNPQSARMIPRRKQIAQMLQRHAKNSRQFLESVI